MSWATLAELKTDLDFEVIDNRDDVPLQDCLDAAITFVERIHPQYFVEGATVPADIKLGTLRLAGRWFTRRRSPDGLVSMADLGAARIPSVDPDIERLLRIGRFRGPVFA